MEQNLIERNLIELLNAAEQGKHVRHFKRTMLSEAELTSEPEKYLYDIIGVAEHTETGEKLMVYRARYGDKRLFARPLEMFLSPVDREKYPDCPQKMRFEIDCT